MPSIKHYARKLFRELGYDVNKRRELLLPKASTNEIFSRNGSVSLQEIASADGNVTPLELLSICALVAGRQPTSLFEIGTFDGRTTLNMIANSPANATIYTLDLPKAHLGNTAFSLDPIEKKYVDKDVSGVRFRDTKWAPRVVQLFGDSAKFDFTPYYGKIDVMFVDGSHHYDYVKSDTEVALKLLSPSGIVIWHDYQPAWPGVIRYLEELHGQGGEFRGLRNIEGTSLVFLRKNIG